jgi:hypothetical protein
MRYGAKNTYGMSDYSKQYTFPNSLHNLTTAFQKQRSCVQSGMKRTDYHEEGISKDSKGTSYCSVSWAYLSCTGLNTLMTVSA